MNDLPTPGPLAEATANATPAEAAPAAQRIEPRLAENGHSLELSPPCGGRWLRDADGGLRPADTDTARAAGLAWPGGTPAA